MYDGSLADATRGRPSTFETQLTLPVDGIRPAPAAFRLVDRLVEAIRVRETYEPTIADWDTAALIRRLERDLAQEWPTAARQAIGSPR